MKVLTREIRPIPRRAVDGWMSIGVIEDASRFFVLEVEPGGEAFLPDGKLAYHQPSVHIIEYYKMKRSEDLLDGDTEIVTLEEFEALKKFAEDNELLTKERVDGAIRMAAMKSLKPPNFSHTYVCLMEAEKTIDWTEHKIGPKPFHLVKTLDCYRCPRKYRDPCSSKLASIFKEKDQQYVVDQEFIGDLDGRSEEEKAARDESQIHLTTRQT